MTSILFQLWSLLRAYQMSLLPCLHLQRRKVAECKASLSIMRFMRIVSCTVGVKCKGKVRPRTGREGLSLTSELDGGGWLTPRPGRFTPGKETRYPSYGRQGGSQDRSGWMRKISPPTRIRSPGRPASSESLYRLSYRDRLVGVILLICVSVNLSKPSN